MPIHPTKLFRRHNVDGNHCMLNYNVSTALCMSVAATVKAGTAARVTCIRAGTCRAATAAGNSSGHNDTRAYRHHDWGQHQQLYIAFYL